ncbi:response regulator [Anaeromyxobacter oryzisoli]|uniref:response regulator n=1 Tax=Anaeromyxobacter oryzisoli TaxID=2925408 RepID=UPI001F56D626|nr:response regulator [Anaeromyxobacter sp. SG63]
MTASRSILLIEDDAGIRESVAECLESEGYVVTPVSNGVEGLQWLRRPHRPNLIVLDLVMPVMSGAQFLSELREDPGLRDLPVVLMTAASPSGTLPIPQANAYLPKPFHLGELLAVVERHSAER